MSISVSMVGQRGVPATYGGIERHVEAIGSELVHLGLGVTVFGRKPYYESRELGGNTVKGMDLKYSPGFGGKHLEAFTYSASAAAMSTFQQFDLVHFHGLGPGVFSGLPRLRRRPTVLTVHGLDYERSKWSPSAQKMFRALGEIALRSCVKVIAVSENLQESIASEFDIESTFIANGVYPPRRLTIDLGSLPTKRPYFLAVGRLVPEKRFDILLRSFKETAGHKFDLVLAGGSSHSSDYVTELKDLAQSDSRIHMVGYKYGEDLANLYRGASAFVQPSALEGMPLTLLEACSFGLPVIASDIPVHVAVVGDSELNDGLFKCDDIIDLRDRLDDVALGSSDFLQRMSSAALSISAEYTWKDAAEKTLSVYEAALSGK